MRRITSQFFVAAVTVVVLSSLAARATACSVPVFRYALERWRTDPYEIFIFHRGELSEEQQKIVDQLGPDGLAGEKFANVHARLIDLAAIGEEPASEVDRLKLALWEKHKGDQLPRVVVKFPLIARRAADAVWSGPLESLNVEQLIDSPARRDIAKQILKGTTAVWVYLESGDKKQDAAKVKLIKERLAYLEKTLQLPEIDAQDVAEGLINVDPSELKVKFTLLSISRTDAAESMFVEMLLGSESDLRDAEFVNQPMAFPIFGRGRALYALVGKGINEITITQACEQLLAPCTCEIKEQNEDGTDLVMSVDWETLIQPTIEVDTALPPLAGIGKTNPIQLPRKPQPQPKDGVKTGSEPLSDSKSDHPAEPQASASVKPSDESNSGGGIGMGRLIRNILLVGGLGLFFIVGTSMFLVKKQ